MATSAVIGMEAERETIEALSPQEAASLAVFPEWRFAPAGRWRGAYAERVAAGYEEMSGRRAVIAGLARDVDWLLPKTIARIERLGRMFADYQVVLYENDSCDSTRAALERWAGNNSRVTLLSETRHDPANRPIACPRRAERMAYYRHQYHDHIAARCADYDDVVVLETDLAGGWSYDGIAHTYGAMDWDFVGSYGVMYKRLGWEVNHTLHYDSWAFRTDADYRTLPTRAVNCMHWDRGTPLVPVYSCFGGLGLYRLEAFLAGEYEGPDCEHVAKHRQMRERGFERIYLNPSQVVIHGRKHRTMDGLVLSWQAMLDACTFCPRVAWFC